MSGLGENKDGSFYIEDNRNIFINPAEINHYTDFISFEYGQDLEGTKPDSSFLGRSEGGFIAQGRALVYGVFLGAENERLNSLRRIINPLLPGDDNKIDLFIGGDSGFKWGVNVGLSQSKDLRDNAGMRSNALLTSVGVIRNEWEFFLDLLVNSSSEVNDQNVTGQLSQVESNLSFTTGFKKIINEYRVYGTFDLYDLSFQGANSQSAIGALAMDRGDLKYTMTRAGIGRVKNVSDNTKIFTNLELQYAKVDFKTPGSSPSTDFWHVPLTIALEYEALSWLNLRSSIGQAIYSAAEDLNSQSFSQNNSTIASGGFSILLGSLVIDGVVGTERVEGLEMLQDTVYRLSLNYSY